MCIFKIVNEQIDPVFGFYLNTGYNFSLKQLIQIILISLKRINCRRELSSDIKYTGLLVSVTYL